MFSINLDNSTLMTTYCVLGVHLGTMGGCHKFMPRNWGGRAQILFLARDGYEWNGLRYFGGFVGEEGEGYQEGC